MASKTVFFTKRKIKPLGKKGFVSTAVKMSYLEKGLTKKVIIMLIQDTEVSSDNTIASHDNPFFLDITI